MDLTCCVYYFTGIKSKEESSYSFYYSRKGRQKWYDILFVPTNMISISTNSNTYINKRQKNLHNFTSKVVLLNNYMFYHNHNSLSLLQPVNDCMFLLLLGFGGGGVWGGGRTVCTLRQPLMIPLLYHHHLAVIPV